MKSLEEHNKAAAKAIGKNHNPIPCGLACPDCGNELNDSKPSAILMTGTPKTPVNCTSCGYSGFRAV